LIVLEATGGFEQVVAAQLAAARLPLVVVNPRQIRDFARATGRLAKTDRMMTSRRSSGSMRADSAVEPTKSENITVT
jgi:transposase